MKLVCLIAASGLVLLASTTLAQADDIGPPVSVFGVAVKVSDIERSAKFYRDIIGLKEAMKIASPNGLLRELVLSSSGKLEESTIVVLYKEDVEHDPKGRQGFGRVILTAADANALASKAKAAGYKIAMVSKPKQPNVAASVIFIEDADGYTVELFQPATAPK
jgi:catechol 2,3-dioxygenase-like lactoylglutathione lyase family enzyme